MGRIREEESCSLVESDIDGDYQEGLNGGQDDCGSEQAQKSENR